MRGARSLATEQSWTGARGARRQNLRRIALGVALTLVVLAGAAAGFAFVLQLAMPLAAAAAVAAVLVPLLGVPTLRTYARQLRWLADWDPAAADAALARLRELAFGELQAVWDSHEYVRQWMVNARWVRPHSDIEWEDFHLTLDKVVMRDTGYPLERVAIRDSIAQRFVGRPPDAPAASAEERAKALLVRARLDLKGWELPVEELFALTVDAQLEGFTLDDAIEVTREGLEAERLDTAYRRYRAVVLAARARYRRARSNRPDPFSRS